MDAARVEADAEVAVGRGKEAHELQIGVVRVHALGKAVHAVVTAGTISETLRVGFEFVAALHRSHGCGGGCVEDLGVSKELPAVLLWRSGAGSELGCVPAAKRLWCCADGSRAG